MVLKILRSRKFAKRVLTALLILIIPAFVLWGVGSMTRRPEIVGLIGNQKIRADDFAKSRQGIKIQILFAYYTNSDTLRQLLRARSLLNSMAWERLILLNAAHKEKVNVTNDDVLSFISRHPMFQRNGVFDKQVYAYILKNTLAMRPRQFEELVRQNLQVKSFRLGLLKDISVSEKEILEDYKKANDKVELSYIIIDKDLFTDQVTVSAEEVEKYYESNKNKFFEPAKIEVEYIKFPYEDTSARNAVVPEIEKIHSEVERSPARFEKIAENSGWRYGKTGPFSLKDVPPGITFFKEFQDTAFALKQGEISRPVFSSPEKGTAYILRKTRDIPRRRQDLKEVEKDIRKTLAGRKCLVLARKKANNLYAEMTETDVTLEETAAALAQQIKTTGPVTSGGYIENVGPAKEIVTRAQKAGEGRILPPIPVKKGAFFARVDAVLPTDEADFREKKENLHKTILSRKQMNAMEKWFKESKAKTELKKSLEDL
ncbi:MAG: hypothetical protein DRP85_07805 [Candidatus Makaraimicrobium thalassicum]|nr:MAG: hypothetical protein DRP85_07805 [Candidatus Omnitrophota bacterium]